MGRYSLLKTRDSYQRTSTSGAAITENQRWLLTVLKAHFMLKLAFGWRSASALD
jgi:hypothetical protein